MSNQPKDNLFYFEEQSDEEQLAETNNPSTSFSPHKTLTKQLYKIQDTNKLSVNFFQRDRNTDNVVKDVILTSNGKRKTSHTGKLSIPSMGSSRDQVRPKLIQKQKGTELEKQTKVESVISEKLQDEKKMKSENKEKESGKQNSDSSQQNIEEFNIQKRENREIKQPHKQESDEENLRTHNDQQPEVQSPEQTTNSDIKIATSEIIDVKSFISNPIPKGKVFQCTLSRDKSGFSRFFPQYSMYTTDGIKYLMSGKKRSGNATSNYLISLDKNDLAKGDNYVGKVRSNWVGTQFLGYDSGYNPQKSQPNNKPRKTLCQIYYESNFFGSKGPRVMDVYVPKSIEQNSSVSTKTLKQMHSQKGNNVIHLINKPPRWNPDTKTFVLNFNNRVDKPSVKNFILTEKGTPVSVTNYSLLFGRIGDDTFNMDVKYPLSPLQAFQIVLSSFDYKLACE